MRRECSLNLPMYGAGLHPVGALERRDNVRSRPSLPDCVFLMDKGDFFLFFFVSAMLVAWIQ
jgi:hypothetical protein